MGESFVFLSLSHVFLLFHFSLCLPFFYISLSPPSLSLSQLLYISLPHLSRFLQFFNISLSIPSLFLSPVLLHLSFSPISCHPSFFPFSRSRLLQFEDNGACPLCEPYTGTFRQWQIVWRKLTSTDLNEINSTPQFDMFFLNALFLQ